MIEPISQENVLEFQGVAGSETQQRHKPDDVREIVDFNI